MDNTALFWLDIPLNIVLLVKFPPIGPFMTELYQTEIRGTGQGFCFNARRAAGSVFPTMVGSATAFGLMIVMLLLLPETHGCSLGTLETPLSHAYSRN